MGFIYPGTSRTVIGQVFKHPRTRKIHWKFQILGNYSYWTNSACLTGFPSFQNPLSLSSSEHALQNNAIRVPNTYRRVFKILTIHTECGQNNPAFAELDNIFLMTSKFPKDTSPEAAENHFTYPKIKRNVETKKKFIEFIIQLPCLLSLSLTSSVRNA